MPALEFGSQVSVVAKAAEWKAVIKIARAMTRTQRAAIKIAQDERRLIRHLVKEAISGCGKCFQDRPQ
jgi:hypothetical protein